MKRDLITDYNRTDSRNKNNERVEIRRSDVGNTGTANGVEKMSFAITFKRTVSLLLSILMLFSVFTFTSSAKVEKEPERTSKNHYFISLNEYLGFGEPEIQPGDKSVIMCCSDPANRSTFECAKGIDIEDYYALINAEETTSYVEGMEECEYSFIKDTGLVCPCCKKIYYLETKINNHDFQPINYTNVAGEVTNYYAATCTTGAGYRYQCSVCELVIKKNNPDDEYDPSDPSMMHLESGALGHDMSVENIVPATCISSGLKTVSCSHTDPNTGVKCPESKSEVIPQPTGSELYNGDAWSIHNLVRAPEMDIKATCIQYACTYYKCTRCDFYYGELINYNKPEGLTDHKWDAGKVTKKATHKAAGVKTYTCTVCKKTKTSSIPIVKNHTWDKGKITKKATCTATGTKTYTCSVCGMTKKETIKKIAHKYYIKMTNKATTQKDGKGYYTCSYCGKKKDNKIVTVPKVTVIKAQWKNYVWNDKVHVPTVTVKDSKGKVLKENTDYTLKYSNKNSRDIGSYTITVTLKGKYYTVKKLNYSIVAPKPEAFSGKITSAYNTTEKVNVWKSNRFTREELFDTRFDPTWAPEVIKSYKKTTVTVGRGITVKWNKSKNKNITGYQLQYSPDKSFKKNNKAVTVGKDKTSATLGSVTGGTYYVRMRSYTKYNSKTTIYSSWSGVKSVKTTYSCGNKNHICRNASDHKYMSTYTWTSGADDGDDICLYCGKPRNNVQTKQECCKRNRVLDKNGKLSTNCICPMYDQKKDPSVYCEHCGLPRGFGIGYCYYTGLASLWGQGIYCEYCGNYRPDNSCHHCTTYDRKDPSTWYVRYNGDNGKKLDKPYYKESHYDIPISEQIEKGIH